MGQKWGLLPLTLGVAMTLALAGYRFGESNHAVYLVDSLRQNEPHLLTNDWWTRSTLQYHVVFNHLSAWLMRAAIIQPVFLSGYIALAVLLHIAWRRLVLCLGGDDAIYLVSVVLYHLLGAGTGLGMYQFLQDSSFLPSNIANVAMLWAVYAWVSGWRVWSGLCFGLAGLFHLNHALMGIGLWFALTVVAAARSREPPKDKRRTRLAWLIGTVLLLGLSLPAIASAVKSVLHKSASLPLTEFVDIYVRLRHPHHYDPSTWPLLLWLTFIVPIALTIPICRRGAPEGRIRERRRALDVFSLFSAALAVALLGAGIWYVSEPLIQMSLYRFSIYPKLLSCIAVAWLIWRIGSARGALRALVMGMLVALSVVIVGRIPVGRFLEANAFAIWVFALFATAALLRPRVEAWGRILFGGLVSVCVVVSLAVSWQRLGIAHPGLRGDDPAYLALCHWVRHNTPEAAVFLVPPDEQSFRLHARRAIVVNYKNVPQLSGELPDWRDRLETVLALEDLRTLPTPFHRTLAEIRARYDALPPLHLAEVARRYGVRYVVATRDLSYVPTGWRLVFSDTANRYRLYDVGLNGP